MNIMQSNFNFNVMLTIVLLLTPCFLLDNVQAGKPDPNKMVFPITITLRPGDADTTSCVYVKDASGIKEEIGILPPDTMEPIKITLNKDDTLILEQEGGSTFAPPFLEFCFNAVDLIPGSYKIGTFHFFKKNKEGETVETRRLLLISRKSIIFRNIKTIITPPEEQISQNLTNNNVINALHFIFS